MGRLLHPKPRAEAWASELTQFLPLRSTKLPFHSQAQGEAGPRTLLLPERTRNSWPDGSVPSAHGPSSLPTGLISVGLGWAGQGRVGCIHWGQAVAEPRESLIFTVSS